MKTSISHRRAISFVINVGGRGLNFTFRNGCTHWKGCHSISSFPFLSLFIGYVTDKFLKNSFIFFAESLIHPDPEMYMYFKLRCTCFKLAKRA